MVSQRGIGHGSFICWPINTQPVNRITLERCVSVCRSHIYTTNRIQRLAVYLFVLHYVIAYDKSVLRFIHRGLESKPICTERMWSPRKIWINGVLREAGEGHHIDYTWLYPRWPKQLWNWSCARSSTESIQNDQQRVTQMYLGRA